MVLNDRTKKIHFAFLDGQHDKQTIEEFNFVSKNQKET